jgi:signal transduction histidine kinase
MTRPFLYLPKNRDAQLDACKDWLSKYEIDHALDMEEIGRLLDIASEEKGSKKSFNVGYYQYILERDEHGLLIYQTTQDCMTQFNRTAEELNAFKVMASALKHDISSSLNNISLQSELLGIKGFTDTNDFQKGIHSIKASVFDANNMLEDLSDFAKLVRNDDDICDINEVLIHTKRLLAKEMKASGAIIAHGAFNTLSYSPSRLMVILKNLISNSIKYSGTVRPQILIHDSLSEDFYKITIADNGIGIPKNDIDKITQPFYRAENVGTVKGTGVGLSTVKSLLGAVGGKMVIRSANTNKTGQSGTNVTLYFPKELLVG